MRNNKFSNNNNIGNSNNNSSLNQLDYKLQLKRADLFNYTTEMIKKEQPLDKKIINEILQIEQQLLRLNREMLKYDHSKLIKDNFNNKSLISSEFNQFSEMLNRDRYHSISEHNQEVKTMINNFVNSIYEEIKISNTNLSSYPPQLKFLNKQLFVIYNQSVFGRTHLIKDLIKENSAAILSDPERPTSFDPIITDHEYLAKFYFAYMFGLKSLNCFQGSGSPDLIVSTLGLKELGLIKEVEKGYLYADFKTGSCKNLGYDERNGDHNINQFIDFIKIHLKIDLFIFDIHPYTKNINQNDINKLDKLIKYLKQCKKKLKDSEDDIIKNKKVLFIDSNIPKVDIKNYYDKLAKLNEIDTEVFNLFKEQIENYINYLEKEKFVNNEGSIDEVRNLSADDSSNNYIKNDAGVYVPKNLLNSSENQIGYFSSNNMAAKNVALTIKYKDASHLTEKELNDFFQNNND